MAARDFRTRLLRRASRTNVVLTTEVADRLSDYYELLSRWNRKINLTSLDDPDAAIDRLLLEPVVAARHLPAPDAKLLDVGSGGGSPAIPLKLIAPELRLTMVEVKARKAAFLREAVRHLNLDHTRVEAARYEELLARPDLHEAMDVVSLRAVRVERKVLTTLQAFLAEGGIIMLFRGASGGDEPATLVPPLEWTGTFPLVDRLRSRLTVLSKRVIGNPRVGVSRGTF